MSITNSKTICVCLASFNGELYIKQQIESILLQLNENDFLVVSDDGSNDNTLLIISEFEDHRIHVISNLKNHGYVGNFENALRYAKIACPSDIIFLSDQDDVWMENKISLIIDLYAVNPRVLMIAHGLQYVDTDLNFLYNSKKSLGYGLLYPLRAFISPVGFGCAMSFRSSLLGSILPFPDKITHTHDHWIEIVSYFSGSCMYIQKPLIKYRRSSTSLTVIESNKKITIDNLLKKIYWRFLTLSMFFVAINRIVYKYLDREI